MTKVKLKKIIDTLKLLLKLDDMEVLKCALESLIEDLEEESK
jgi:hypothetical protein